jgi:predicted ATPase
MRIIELRAENVKNLKVVDITPRGNVVQVTGKNGSGKTSVLDSIWWALAGADNIQGVPVRKGAESMRIRLNLGELIVERKQTVAGSRTITVRNPKQRADGSEAAPGTPDAKLFKFDSPQEMLDALKRCEPRCEGQTRASGRHRGSGGYARTAD